MTKALTAIKRQLKTVDPIEEKYGPAYFERESAKGGASYDGINESYWAGHHASHHVELFEPSEKTFYKYDKTTGLFEEITPAIIKQEISDCMLQLGRKKQLQELIRDRTDTRLNSVIGHLKGIVERRDAFRKSETIIHCANGMLVFREGEPRLMPFSPEYRSRNRSPIAYDATATCPRFLNELILPALHPEDVAIVQKYMGLCLLARNVIQRLLILDGESGRGKTQLAIVIQLLVGLLNSTQLRTEHLHERFELYRFLKKTLLVGADVPGDFLSTKGATVLKALVGGDILDAEQKSGTGCFPLEGNFCVVLTSNSRLRVRLEGDVGAWRRRLLIVRYEAPPPAKKIPDFAKRLIESEGAGILNWALEGLQALMGDVDSCGDIRLTDRQLGVVDSLLSESDSLRVFLQSCVERDPDSDLTTFEIIEAYAEFCPSRGWSPLPITVVQRQVEGLMLEIHQTAKGHSIQRDGKAQKGFRNVRIRDFGTLGTPLLNPRVYAGARTDDLIEFETPVPSVPKRGTMPELPLGAVL